MKFSAGDRVRVIAWCIPGVSSTLKQQIVCGEVGVVVKVRTDSPKANSDGTYQVALDSNKAHAWWFRACDLVVEDSACTCSNTAEKKIIGVCVIHDRPDPDPADEVAQKLLAMVQAMEDDLDG